MRYIVRVLWLQLDYLLRSCYYHT